MLSGPNVRARVQEGKLLGRAVRVVLRGAQKWRGGLRASEGAVGDLREAKKPFQVVRGG